MGRDYVAVYAGKSLLGDPVVYQNCIEPETRVLGCLSSGSFMGLAVQVASRLRSSRTSIVHERDREEVQP